MRFTHQAERPTTQQAQAQTTSTVGQVIFRSSEVVTGSASEVKLILFSAARSRGEAGDASASPEAGKRSGVPDRLLSKLTTSTSKRRPREHRRRKTAELLQHSQQSLHRRHHADTISAPVVAAFASQDFSGILSR